MSADALLPDGPYDLWRAGETRRFVKDLVGAFAQFPHLPKMLNRKAILDTLVAGCEAGMFVLQLTRPDRSVLTVDLDAVGKAGSLERNVTLRPGDFIVIPEGAAPTVLVLAWGQTGAIAAAEIKRIVARCFTLALLFYP